jgi:hypothetical protein
MNVAPITRKFKDIAKLAIGRMHDELESGHGKVIYKDYKITIEKYLIPTLGKNYVYASHLAMIDPNAERFTCLKLVTCSNGADILKEIYNFYKLIVRAL